MKRREHLAWRIYKAVVVDGLNANVAHMRLRRAGFGADETRELIREAKKLQRVGS